MMTACSSHPSELAVRLTQAANAGNYEFILDNSITADGDALSASQKEQLLHLLNTQAKQMDTIQNAIKHIKVVQEKFAADGIHATVTLHIVYTNNQPKDETCNLLRVEGLWQYVLP